MQIVAQYIKKYPTLLNRYGLTNNKRLAMFFGQALAEAPNLKPQRESGFYRDVAYVRSIFKTPFKGKSDDFVRQYLRNSVKMLNYVYANRMGNGSEATGDGYFFRGGGIFQNTGRAQYRKLQDSTGIAFEKKPELIMQEDNSLIAALEFWKNQNLNKYADDWGIDTVSDLINIGVRTKAYGDANHFNIRKENCNNVLKFLS